MQTYLKPLGAPISALVSRGPFFLPFLSFFPLQKEAGEGTGTLEDRYREAKMSGFGISIVAIPPGSISGPENKYSIQYLKPESRYTHQ